MLAGAYMTVLAGRLSERAYFEPLTDQVDLRIATPSNDVQAAMNLLLGRRHVSQKAAEGDTAAGVAAYVMLAMQYARPKNLDTIPADKIVQCREALAEELQTFRDYVDSQRVELAELARILGYPSRAEDSNPSPSMCSTRSRDPSSSLKKVCGFTSLSRPDLSSWLDPPPLLSRSAPSWKPQARRRKLSPQRVRSRPSAARGGNWKRSADMTGRARQWAIC